MKLIDERYIGPIYSPCCAVKARELEWNQHPVFGGVSMKHLITGAQTNGRISCHLVRVDPSCVIGLHCHTGQIEIHEVIYGRAVCRIGQKEIDYCTGTLCVIPEDEEHAVYAGEEGLTLLAKFSPALL